MSVFFLFWFYNSLNCHYFNQKYNIKTKIKIIKSMKKIKTQQNEMKCNLRIEMKKKSDEPDYIRWH